MYTGGACKHLPEGGHDVYSTMQVCIIIGKN